MIEKINEMLKQGKIKDVYILARYYYREGQPFMSDSTYDKIHEKMVENGLLSEYTSRTYDEDPVPRNLILANGLPWLEEEHKSGKDNPYYNELTYESSLSIRPVTTYEESWEYFKSVRGKRLIAMSKVNGIYTRHKIDKGLKLSLTRGRSEADPWDITEQMKLVIGGASENIKEPIRINGEAFVETKVLEYLAEKYDGHLPPESRRFKTEKSAAISLLRVRREEELYQHCKFLMFSSDGLSDTVSGTLAKGKEMGFDVVPHRVIESNEVPETLDEFKEWLRGLMDEMLELQGDIPADGVVIDVDDLNYIPDVKNQYSSRNIALKLEHWSHEYYTGIVSDIIEEQKAVTCSYVIVIDPVVTNDRTTARRINAFNPAIIFNEGITKGKRIYFERNSGAVNILLHGDKVPVKDSNHINSFREGN